MSIHIKILTQFSTSMYLLVTNTYNPDHKYKKKEKKEKKSAVFESMFASHFFPDLHQTPCVE